MWLNRTTKQFIPRASPSSMSELFPADMPFIGVDGNAASNAAWIFKPDLLAVRGLAPKYWIITGDNVTAMSAAQQRAVDDAELSTRRDGQADQLDRAELLIRAFALVVLDEINLLRNQHSLAPRTIAQLKNAVRSKLGS